MNKKKGFTLIELIGVIVLLTIIALIAIPSIMNLINEAIKKSFVNSAYAIIKAGDLYYSTQNMMGKLTTDRTEFEFPNDINKLDLDGQMPESGQMIIKPTGDIALAITNGKYCIIKRFNSNDLDISENIDECEISWVIKSDNSCIDMLEICPNGTKVQVRVNKDKIYDFYVINDDNKEITLFMSEPIGDYLNWINYEDYTLMGETDYNSWQNHTKFGPLTALKQLKLRTDDWTNIPEQDYVTIDDDSPKLYDDITIKMRARLLTKTEAMNLGCKTTSGSCPEYLLPLESNGYWLSNASGATHSSCVNINGYIENVYHDNWKFLRPVITLSKTI